MRTLRLSLIATVTVALLCGMCGAVVAQREEPEVATVTGNRLTLELDTSEAGLVTIETYAWSDPRLPVDSRSVLSLTADRVINGAVLLEGPTGSWHGTYEAFAHDDGTGHGMLRLTGAGAYEGLIAFLHAYTDDRDCVECLQYDGIIVEGEMPPMPGPVVPPAE